MGSLALAGGICAVLGFLVFTGSVLAAVSLKPGYDIANQFLSQLGAGGPSAPVFNNAVILSGILLLVFFLGLHSYLGTGKFGVLFGVLASLALVGVGAFPVNNALGSGQMHNYMSYAFFIL